MPSAENFTLGAKGLRKKICTLSMCKQIVFEANVVTQVSKSERLL